MSPAQRKPSPNTTPVPLPTCNASEVRTEEFGMSDRRARANRRHARRSARGQPSAGRDDRVRAIGASPTLLHGHPPEPSPEQNGTWGSRRFDEEEADPSRSRCRRARDRGRRPRRSRSSSRRRGTPGGTRSRRRRALRRRCATGSSGGPARLAVADDHRVDTAVLVNRPAAEAHSTGKSPALTSTNAPLSLR